VLIVYFIIEVYEIDPTYRGYPIEVQKRIMITFGLGVIAGLVDIHPLIYTTVSIGAKVLEAYTTYKEATEGRIDDLLAGALGYLIGRAAFERAVLERCGKA